VPDREDLLHTIIANLADAGKNNGHKPDNQSWMYRIASFSKAQYWRDHYRHINGLTCGNCSTKQRRKCKEEWLYGKCPKLVKIESLNKPITDSEGNLTELGNLIADDRTLDLDAWLDYKAFLLTSPERALTHNKGYRKRCRCVKISVTEGGRGDTTQHYRIRTGTKEPIFWGIKRREGQDIG
jgi:hypothetical protein